MYIFIFELVNGLITNIEFSFSVYNWFAHTIMLQYPVCDGSMVYCYLDHCSTSHQVIHQFACDLIAPSMWGDTS